MTIPDTHFWNVTLELLSASDITHQRIWIGLKSQLDSSSNGLYHYIWTDGSNTTQYQNWLNIPLQITISNEMCALALRPIGWKWFSYNCNTTYSKGFICEKRKLLNITTVFYFIGDPRL